MLVLRVCVHAFKRVSLLLERFLCSLVQCVEEGVLYRLVQNASRCEEAAPTQPLTSAAQRVAATAASAQPQRAARIKKHNHFPHHFISMDSGGDPNSVRQGDRQISILLAKIST